MNYKLTSWSNTDLLWIWRQEKGLDCAAAAKQLGTGRTTYWMMENGKHAIPKAGWSPVLKPSLKTLLRLARRRSRLTTFQVAKRFKTSRMTLLVWERTANQGLKDLWEKRGFIFK